MSSEMSLNDFSESLTGFEEVAVERAFAGDLLSLQDKPTTLVRALIFVDLKRQGQNDKDAKNAAMSLTLREAMAYFPAEEEEVMPDHPVTESGKDEKPAA